MSVIMLLRLRDQQRATAPVVAKGHPVLDREVILLQSNRIDKRRSLPLTPISKPVSCDFEPRLWR
jgi:hypothetical protein